MISVFFLMVWLLNSQGMKNCKSTESFCCSILAIYTNEWSTFWYVYCCYVYFFSARLLNMYKPRTTFYISFEGLPTWIGILWKCASMITQLAGIERRLAWFHAIRNLLANKIYHFSRLFNHIGWLFTHSILSAPYSATLACSRMLFRIKCWS